MGKTDSFVLTYHSIDESGSVVSISPALFREQVKIVKESGIPVVPLDRVAMSQGSVAFTFDDGYRNFLDHALPVLAEAGIPATVFAVTGYCGRESSWAGKAPRLPLMTWTELCELRSAGMDIGAHSVNHPDLRSLGDDSLAEELDRSRAELEDRLGCAANLFAYPYGACNERVKRFTSERYSLACGTRLRFVEKNVDPFDLPRLDAYYLRSLDRFRSLMHGQATGYIGLRRILREARSWLFQ